MPDPNTLARNKQKLLIMGSLCVAAIYFLIGCSNANQSEQSAYSKEQQPKPNQDTQYKQNLESNIKSLIKNDSEITESIILFNEQGGINASRKRAIENCQSLAKGTPIEELTTKESTERAFKDLNVSSFSDDEKLKQTQLLGKIYLAEVFAAQANYCPETKKEFKIEG